MPPSSRYVDLRGHSPNAGHALASYLYTGEYDLPKWPGPVDPSVNLSLLDLRTHFEIYALARTFSVRDLEQQARSTIEWLARKLNVFSIIDVVKTAYPTPIGDDSWLRPWITSTIKSALRDPRTLVPKETQGTPNLADDASVLKMIFACMLETYTGMVESLPNSDREDLSDLDTPTTSSEASTRFNLSVLHDQVTPRPREPLSFDTPEWADEQKRQILASFASKSWTAARELEVGPGQNPEGKKSGTVDEIKAGSWWEAEPESRRVTWRASLPVQEPQPAVVRRRA